MTFIDTPPEVQRLDERITAACRQVVDAIGAQGCVVLGQRFRSGVALPEEHAGLFMKLAGDHAVLILAHDDSATWHERVPSRQPVSVTADGALVLPAAGPDFVPQSVGALGGYVARLIGEHLAQYPDDAHRFPEVDDALIASLFES
jgi:hypothetical protein